MWAEHGGGAPFCHSHSPVLPGDQADVQMCVYFQAVGLACEGENEAHKRNSSKDESTGWSMGMLSQKNWVVPQYLFLHRLYKRGSTHEGNQAINDLLPT